MHVRSPSDFLMCTVAKQEGEQGYKVLMNSEEAHTISLPRGPGLFNLHTRVRNMPTNANTLSFVSFGHTVPVDILFITMIYET